MAFLDLVKKRQSVRKYAARPVPREAIEQCLKAVQLSPSTCNSQPWYFIIVDDEALRKRVADAAFSGMYSMNSSVKDAPVLVVVVRDRSKYLAILGGRCRGIPFSLIDIGIACEHFVLQAVEEGIGTCYMGWFNETAVKKVLDIPRSMKADLIISMGYPADAQERVKTRKLLSEIHRFNK